MYCNLYLKSNSVISSCCNKLKLGKIKNENQREDSKTVLKNVQDTKEKVLTLDFVLNFMFIFFF